MDFLKVRLFTSKLIYDLNTVQYLLDYDRIKETLPIIEKILDDIGSFQTNNLKNSSSDLFSEKFWHKKLPPDMSLSEMHAQISKFAHAKSEIVEEDLDKINYKDFVKNIFSWSQENTPALKHAAKSPLHKKIDRKVSLLTTITIGLSLVIILNWLFMTRNWGLTGCFYQGKGFNKYLYSGYKKTIDFSYPQEMDPRLPHDHFSARWEGKLLVPQDGKYMIFVTSDDGVKIYIDRNLLIDDWSIHGPTESFKEIFLSKGPHQILLKYFQYINGAVLKLSWARDGGKKEIIPAKYLRH